MTTAPGPSRRAASIAPFHVMRLLARARELEASGRDVVHMEIGEPDFPTPGPIIEAGQRALAAGRLGYTPTAGLPELRTAIAGYYRRRFDLDLDPRRVLVTPGASGALQVVLASLLDFGLEVLMTDPGYPCNRHLVNLLGGIPRPLPVGPDTDYQLTGERVAAEWRAATRLAMVASPANPTGTILSTAQLTDLARAVEARDGYLVVDEIYQGLTYGEADRTAAAIPSKRLFVVNSFSKYFGMTGWRLGWIVAPEAFIGPLERVAQNLYLAAPTPSQHAAVAAFEPATLGLLEERRQAFEERRDYLLPALEALGFEFAVKPRGAFYLYAGCDERIGDSAIFAQDLLDRQAVAVAPGNDFGDHLAARHLRFAYTTDIEHLAEGVRRIAALLG